MIEANRNTLVAPVDSCWMYFHTRRDRNTTFSSCLFLIYFENARPIAGIAHLKNHAKAPRIETTVSCFPQSGKVAHKWCNESMLSILLNYSAEGTLWPERRLRAIPLVCDDLLDDRSNTSLLRP